MFVAGALGVGEDGQGRCVGRETVAISWKLSHFSLKGVLTYPGNGGLVGLN